MESLLLYVPLALSIIALAVSVRAWHKSRAIYGVELSVIRQPRGDRTDAFINQKDLNEKLNSGHYTILAVMERRADKDWEILMGRLKPYTQ